MTSPVRVTCRCLSTLVVLTTDRIESSKPSAAATDSQPSKTSATAVTTGKLAAATTGKSSESGTKTTGKGAAKTTDKEPQDTDVDPRLPPGGVNMITPSALATSTYYKIGVDSVSLVWNYTSLSVSPSKIDILVTCTANQATYTLASNQSYEETGSVVWDTKAEETGQNPLLTEKYTLIIHDAEKAVTDRPDSGHLGSYNQFVFGMYVPQPYTPRAREFDPCPCLYIS